jgi:hypothetical protein
MVRSGGLRWVRSIRAFSSEVETGSRQENASTRSDNSGRLRLCGDVGMKLIASMWTIPAALCLSGAFADELTTSEDAKSLGFPAPRRAAAKSVNGRIE